MKKLAAVTLAAIICTAPFGAWAFPNGPVEVIVPSGPGSGMDNLARTIAMHLETELGVPFPVVNRPGAGQATAARALIEAAADGQTIMIAHPQLLVSAATGILGFQPLEEMKPLAQTGRMENFLASPANAPFDTLEELLAYAKDRPGEINVAIDGILGLDHIVVLQLAEEMGVEFNYVNIPGGGPPKVQSLMGGFSSLGVLGPGPFGGVYRSGDLKAVATLTNSDDPSPSFPEIPTTKVQGYSAEFALSWWWFVRDDTPEEATTALADAIAKVMADPAVRAEIVERGITEPTYADAATARGQIEESLAGIAEVVAQVAPTR